MKGPQDAETLNPGLSSGHRFPLGGEDWKSLTAPSTIFLAKGAYSDLPPPGKHSLCLCVVSTFVLCINRSLHSPLKANIPVVAGRPALFCGCRERSVALRAPDGDGRGRTGRPAAALALPGRLAGAHVCVWEICLQAECARLTATRRRSAHVARPALSPPLL